MVGVELSAGVALGSGVGVGDSTSVVGMGVIVSIDEEAGVNSGVDSGVASGVGSSIGSEVSSGDSEGEAITEGVGSIVMIGSGCDSCSGSPNPLRRATTSQSNVPVLDPFISLTMNPYLLFASM